MNWTDRRWLASFFLLMALGLGWIIAPEHPDSSYLRARYAQHLVDGDGFVYNPDEDILLTSAPLMVLAHAVTALPSGEINGPPMMLNLVILALGAFALMQVLLLENIRAQLAFAAALTWLIGGFVAFGGVESWLASFSFLAFILAEKNPRCAGFIAGLMLLLAPLALFFVILLGLFSERKFWHFAPLPALMWYAFAVVRFGLDGLRGLTLASAPGEGFPGVVSILILVPLIFWLTTIRSTRAMILVLWGLGYGLVAVVFNLTSDAMMIVSAGAILAAMNKGGFVGDLINNRRIWDYLIYPSSLIGRGFSARNASSPPASGGRLRGGSKKLVVANLASVLIFVGVIFLALVASDEPSLAVPNLDGSKGHVGGNQEAFRLGGTVVQLNGTRDPHLRELVESGDAAGVIIASAPDFLLIPPDDLPDDPALNLLGYHFIADRAEIALQRGAVVSTWGEAQSVAVDFGPDLRLTSVQNDRTQASAGGIVRLRLDWLMQTNKRPNDRLLFIFQMLDRAGGVVGGVEQRFPPEKWRADRITTYHVLPINADALPGLYDVRLAVDLDGGIIDRRTVMQIKIPAPTDVIFDEAPLARFDDGIQMADLMIADVNQGQNDIVLNLTWRAGGSFDADTLIFVHLTAPDDPSPLAQADAPPRYPMGIWAAGEVIEETFVLSLTDIPPGDYVIRLGLFHPEHGRIPANGGDAYVVELD